MISNRCARKSLVTNWNSIISKNYLRFLVDSNDLLSALIAEFFRKYGIADDIISFYQGFMSQQFVSLSWGLTVVLLCLLAGYPLYVKKIYIKL